MCQYIINMIKYKIGDISCRLDFEKFLSIITNTNETYYKSDFKNFPHLYEYIEKNIKHIKNIKFDGYEYFLENGILHNLYGPAIIHYNSETSYFNKGQSNRFYIDGRLVHDNINNIGRGSTDIETFKNEEIFFYEEITYKRTGKDPITGIHYRRKEGIDYIKTIINLEERIKIDQRNKKLKKLNKKKYF